MHNERQNVVYRRAAATLCLCCLGGILCAGLWPFHSPANQVHWLSNENGLAFGRYGSIVSGGKLHANGLNSGIQASSLELWLQPSRIDGKHTILAFDESDHPGTPFALQQSKDGLNVIRYNIDGHGIARTGWFEVRHVFREDQRVLLTITLGPRETSVYVNGALAETAPILGASDNNLTGRLVLANSPSVNDSWSGEISGLAIYQRELTPAEIAQHDENWTKIRQPVIAGGESPAALYLFNERQGNVVRNHVDPETSLNIPVHYFVLHPLVLSSVRHDYKATWSYWGDVVINIAGFIPMGFFALACLSSFRSGKSAVAMTVAFGFVVSAAIELLQSLLPTRSSGVTDMITNTLGTALGAAFYQRSFTQRLLSRISFGEDNSLQTSAAERFGVSESTVASLCSMK